MTRQEAAAVVALFVAAWPQSAADETTATLWVHALDTVPADIGREAALHLVATRDWWPTIAEFNRTVTDLRRQQARNEPAPDGPAQCDGTGWRPAHDGLEPCPQCNPWLRSEYDSGTLHLARKAPADLVMPPPCRPTPDPTGCAVNGPALAAAAYHAATTEAGRHPNPEIARHIATGNLAATLEGTNR